MKDYFKLAFVGITCVLVGLYLGTLLSQETENQLLPPNVYGLPLSELWEIVLQEIGASNESTLNRFYVEMDEKGNLKHLILEFSEVKCKPCRTYHVEYVNGKLGYYSAEVENVKAGLHPLTLFKELEKLNFRDVLRDYSYKGFVIDAEMESGRVGYSSNFTKIYLLLNGSLIPLKRIIFDSEIPWCRVTISKMKYAKNGSMIEGRSVGGIVVFLPEDLNKVAIAEPLIDVTPRVGEYLTDELFILVNNETKILLKDAKLTLCTLNETCPPSRKGEVGIEVFGTVRNEYENDYYVCLYALAYDLKGNVAGRSVDYGPVCGSTVLHLRSGEEKEFRLHLELRESISKIKILVGCLSGIPPP